MEKIEIDKFLAISSGHGTGSGDGYGYGDGDGTGYGSCYGYGSGDGSCYGSGDGDGDGSGYGSGDGDGYGYGHGTGYGSGTGCGYGTGYGSGDGSGIKSINGEDVYMVDGMQTVFMSIRGRHARVKIIQSDLTTKDAYLARVGNFFGHGATLHDAQLAAQEKYDESRPVEERIADFTAAYPTLDSTAQGKDFYKWHHVLTGSCVFGRDQFVNEHSVDLDKTYTVGYFLELVKTSYGGAIIEQVINAYK